MDTSSSAAPLGWTTFLERQSREPDWEHSFVARNFLLEERLTDQRWESYAASGARQHHATRQEWQKAHHRYLEERIWRANSSSTLPRTLDPSDSDQCPETYAFAASFFEYDGSLHLIRIEDVASFALLIKRSPSDVLAAARDWLSAPGSAEAEVWRDFVADRNSRSMIRPTFAVLLEEIEGVFEQTDWPDRVRDLLGLLHFNPGTVGRDIDILVFRYPVNSVTKLQGAPANERPLAPPTALDMRFSAAFCPGPKGFDTGFVIDLSGGGASPRREIVHPTSPDEPGHLWRTGTITKPVPLGDVPVARALHLAALQRETGRTDFGQNTDQDLLS